jgi:hypothetical protein
MKADEFPKITREIRSENISKLTGDKKRFLDYAEKIKYKFDGPSAYFYKKIIRINRNTQDYSSLFQNDLFLEYLYATLASWGMHRMDKNTRMANFDDFKKSILESKDLFIKLSNKKLQEVDLTDLMKDILKIFNSLKIMARSESPKFVANSKVMHFLLPDLIPPMDKGNILYFFYGWLSKDKKGKFVKRNPHEIKIKENSYFWEILNRFKEIVIKLKLTKNDLQHEWDTSIPKLIDNAIIGFNLENKV